MFSMESSLEVFELDRFKVSMLHHSTELPNDFPFTATPPPLES